MGVSLIKTPGGEVRVETGVGTVMKVEDKGERNVQVQIRADHLDKPVTGWADTHAGQLPALGDRVAYRVDVHRKRKIDASRPFEALESHEKVRDLVAMNPVAGDGVAELRELELGLRADGPPPGSSVPQNAPPAPTPPTPAPAPPTANPGGSSAKSGGAPTCVRCHQALAGAPVTRVEGGYAHKGDCPADPGRPFTEGPDVDPFTGKPWEAGTPRPPSQQEAVPAPQQAVREPQDPEGPPQLGPVVATVNVPARKPRVAEGKPWELYNSDGSLNMGSYAMTAAVGFVELAHRLAADQAAKWTAEGSSEHVSMAQVKSLAKTLLSAADRVQAANRNDGHTDRLDNSHTRARGAVREALWVYPVPWGADEPARQAWLEELVEHASSLMAMAVALHAEHVNPEGRP